MARKRAPGAGRKPRGKYGNVTSTLTVRMPDDVRAMLEESAARREPNGWSLAQELIHRIKGSFGKGEKI
jgi:hypothetical protein